MQFTPRDLEYFAAVAESGSLLRAAERLGLSQPALSKALRRLEAAIGAKVVQRVPRGIELTMVGRSLLVHANRIQLAYEDALREAADLGQGRQGHLRIGAGAAMAQFLLPPACALCVSEAGDVSIKVSVAANDTLIPALRGGEYDLVISGIPVKPLEGLTQEFIYDEEFVVYASARHPLVRKRTLHLEDLTAQGWATSGSNVLSWRWLQGAFEGHGLPSPRIVVDTSSTAIKFPLIASSNLLGFGARRTLIEGARHHGLAELRIRELSWRRRVGVSYRENSYLSPAAIRFIAVLRRVAAMPRA